MDIQSEVVFNVLKVQCQSDFKRLTGCDFDSIFSVADAFDSFMSQYERVGILLKYIKQNFLMTSVSSTPVSSVPSVPSDPSSPTLSASSVPVPSVPFVPSDPSSPTPSAKTLEDGADEPKLNETYFGVADDKGEPVNLVPEMPSEEEQEEDVPDVKSTDDLGNEPESEEPINDSDIGFSISEVSFPVSEVEEGTESESLVNGEKTIFDFTQFAPKNKIISVSFNNAILSPKDMSPNSLFISLMRYCFMHNRLRFSQLQSSLVDASSNHQFLVEQCIRVMFSNETIRRLSVLQSDSDFTSFRFVSDVKIAMVVRAIFELGSDFDYGVSIKVSSAR